MLFELRGLGALPALPPRSMLRAGNEWVRYLTGPDAQWGTCPPNPPHGCTMYGGYAWGQRKEGFGEHNFVYIQPSASTATPTPTSSSTEKECAELVNKWLRALSPEKRACLTRVHMTQILEWCIAYKSGVISLRDYTGKRAALLEDACIRKGCRDFFLAWRQASPDLAACLTPTDVDYALHICFLAEKGQITREDSAKRLNQLITQACAREEPSAPVESPTPTAPVPTPTTTTAAGNGGGGGGGAIPAPGPIVTTANGDGAGIGRFIGPVVGIGLLAALGLTVATQGKKKRRLTRRRR